VYRDGIVDRVKNSTTRCTRFWKVMESTPQQILESPGKPPEMCMNHDSEIGYGKSIWYVKNQC